MYFNRVFLRSDIRGPIIRVIRRRRHFADAFSRSRGDILKRIIVFIDGNNFENAVNNLYGQQVRLKLDELAEHIAQKRGGHLEKFYYYTAKSKRKEDKAKADSTQQFVNFLNRNLPKCKAKVGFLKWEGQTASGKDLYIEKETDVMIATDMMSSAYDNLYDEAIILSADTDYRPVIEEIQKRNKKVVAGIVDQQTAGYMKQICDDFLILSKAELDKVKR